MSLYIITMPDGARMEVEAEDRTKAIKSVVGEQALSYQWTAVDGTHHFIEKHNPNKYWSIAKL